MEDILASIRRILNEDEPAATPPAEPAPPGQEPLDLTEEMLVGGASQQPEPQSPAANPSAPAPEPPSATASAAQPTIPAASGRDALLAPAVAAAASASVGHLLRTVAAERSSAISRGGPTIEDVVREELRPLLKEWLDQHLPGLVERLVRAEIERVVGRALS
jgi:cell pole-organizing protein PopZ